LIYGALFSALLILLRLVWTYPGAYFANLIRRKIFRQKEKVPSLTQIFVVGWTGMRGVISLAAAIALPQTLDNGELFVQRNFIIFLAFSVILVTLVFQGLTLPPLIRALHLAGAPETDTEENEARRTILQTVLRRLAQSAEKDDPQFATVYQDLIQHYQQRLDSISQNLELAEPDAGSHLYKRFVSLSEEMLQVERAAAVQLRTEGRIDDELLRRIERELDLEETRLLL
jgi:CPA1 family monovalent cation:H+ antiporter